MQKNVILQTSNTQIFFLLSNSTSPSCCPSIYAEKCYLPDFKHTQKKTIRHGNPRAPLHSSKPHAENIRQNGKPEKSRQEHQVPIMHATDQQTMHNSRMTSDIWNQLPAQVQRFPATVSHSFCPSKSDPWPNHAIRSPAKSIRRKQHQWPRTP
jgi:hypothetical protein